MRRDFLFQHPVFGRRAKVDAYGCEQSVYYWWWYALTLNDKYGAFCERMAAGGVATSDEQDLMRVYADFGDVRYDRSFVSSHSAFKRWWTAGTGERYDNGREIRRGEYLFAEAIRADEAKVRVLNTAQERSEVLNDSRVLVLSIPLTASRKYVDKCLDGILGRNIKATARSKRARNVKTSSAKYTLNTYPVLANIRECIRCYELRLDAEQRGVKVTNLDIAKRLRIKYTPKASHIDASGRHMVSKADVTKARQNAVTRKLSDAKRLIANTINGQFC